MSNQSIFQNPKQLQNTINDAKDTIHQFENELQSIIQQKALLSSTLTSVQVNNRIQNIHFQLQRAKQQLAQLEQVQKQRDEIHSKFLSNDVSPSSSPVATHNRNKNQKEIKYLKNP